MTPFAGVMIELPDPDKPLLGFHVVLWTPSAARARVQRNGDLGRGNGLVARSNSGLFALSKTRMHS